jgi:hypothetical protein
MLPRAIFSPLVAPFVMAAERLLFYDVDPQTLASTDREAIRYYIESLSEKFMTPCSRSLSPSRDPARKRHGKSAE